MGVPVPPATIDYSLLLNMAVKVVQVSCIGFESGTA